MVGVSSLPMALRIVMANGAPVTYEERSEPALIAGRRGSPVMDRAVDHSAMSGTGWVSRHG